MNTITTSPMAIWPVPMRAESVTGFWLTGDASWWSVMDDFGTCVEIDVRTFNDWLLSGEVVQ